MISGQSYENRTVTLSFLGVVQWPLWVHQRGLRHAEVEAWLRCCFAKVFPSRHLRLELRIFPLVRFGSAFTLQTIGHGCGPIQVELQEIVWSSIHSNPRIKTLDSISKFLHPDRSWQDRAIFREEWFASRQRKEVEFRYRFFHGKKWGWV